MAIAPLVGRASRAVGCRVYPPAGPATPPADLRIPEDLAAFYEICGGVDLYANHDYALSIVGPNDLRSANIAILGEDYPGDISSSWYTIGVTPDREYLSIDLSARRNGRCYDSFHEVHGLVGSCPIIASSFTELLERLLESSGGRWYWLDPDFVDLGDAYD
ncbi:MULTISPECIES: SMI1/KNR4 family protein [unclassified Pseudofrankia]|uniref:SMI1/KNR4 family protein n=1 Tax=unclassified Pseudofrankia TaxID=2994372 RepID=UPI0009F71D38|nr:MULTISPECIES: SMI1/KNR4 family protein [unclassified Pseudofrankia]MDT3443601.1 SMI1/KNR4 family protein [Pseudofrankia sp. BMG5.37]